MKSFFDLVNKLISNKKKRTELKPPISPPTHPKQYRAIGLLYGKYQHIENKLTQGFLTINNHQIIEAVLLGKMICMIKNHVNLAQEHLWVVYPRIQPNTDKFQVQIAGIWEPETLKKDFSKINISDNDLTYQHGDFSIRGEVIFYSQKEEKVIVKIVQSLKRDSQKLTSSKLKLKGIIPHYSLGHFFDFETVLEGNNLVIQKKTDLGLLPRQIKSKARRKHN